jgi:hypothetical protein
MCNGDNFFIDNNEEIIHSHSSNYENLKNVNGYKELKKFIKNWNQVYIIDNQMTFTKDSQVLKDF